MFQLALLVCIVRESCIRWVIGISIVLSSLLSPIADTEASAAAPAIELVVLFSASWGLLFHSCFVGAGKMVLASLMSPSNGGYFWVL